LEGDLEAFQEWRLGGGIWKMQVYIETLPELCICTKPPNFGVEVHMKAPTGVALIQHAKEGGEESNRKGRGGKELGLRVSV
jgi:hypothetical protein